MNNYNDIQVTYPDGSVKTIKKVRRVRYDKEHGCYTVYTEDNTAITLRQGAKIGAEEKEHIVV